MYKQMFEIIEYALNDKKYDKKINDSTHLSRVIAENGLIGLVFEYINLEDFDEKHQMLLKKSYYQYISKDVKQRIVIDDLNTIMNENKFNHIFLKGSHLKTMYPRSYMRGMGDIDLLVEQKCFNNVKKLLINKGYILKNKAYVHDTFQSENGTMIELHPFIQHDFDSRYDGYFIDPFNQMIPTNDFNKTFNPDYELTYLLYHLAKHIKHGGIGIRSILDIYIFTQHETIDFKKLKQRLEDTKLKKFFETIINTFNQNFNQDIHMQGFDFDQLDEKHINDFITHISKMGIHGSAKGNDVYQLMIESQVTNDGKSKLKYLFKTAFPSYKKISYKYKMIKYMPLLLPFYWVFRIFKLLIFKSKSSFQKLKAIKNTKKSNQHKSMIDELDL
jgi:hypothetical protein